MQPQVAEMHPGVYCVPLKVLISSGRKEELWHFRKNSTSSASVAGSPRRSWRRRWTSPGRRFPSGSPDGHCGKLLTVSEYFGVSLDELMKEDPQTPQPAAQEQKEPEKIEPEANAPDKPSPKKRTLGLIVCISGLVCLILFGLLSLLFPASSEELAASSVIRLDGRGIALGLCVLATVTGAVLLLKNTSDK